jgi:hypothetical protein
VTRVRSVQDVYLRRPWASPTFWAGSRWSRKLAAAFTTTDHFYMPASAGDGDWRALLPRLESWRADATLEIGVHPGTDEDWRAAERAGLERFVDAAAGAHELIGWDEIG